MDIVPCTCVSSCREGERVVALVGAIPAVVIAVVAGVIVFTDCI